MSAEPPKRDEDDGFDRGYEGHQQRQARHGRELTQAQRLRWLEQTLNEMRRLVGRIPRRRP